MEGASQVPAEGHDEEKPIPMLLLSAEEVEGYKRDLEQARKSAQDNSEGWQRERADFLNYKRRIEREQDSSRQMITANVIKKYLAVADDLERAIKARPTEGAGASWADGIELVLRKLNLILEAEGITRIPAETEMFDPTRHEALTQEVSPDHQSGQVIEVIQQGYMLGERVIRPALVRVAQ